MIGAGEAYQIFPANICDEISEAIDVLNFSNEFAACFMSPWHFETDARVDNWSERFDRFAAREPRGGRCEYITPMKCRADGAQKILFVCQLANLDIDLGSENAAEDSIVGRDKVLLHGECEQGPAFAPHAGVH